jgi:hypothetical protein
MLKFYFLKRSRKSNTKFPFKTVFFSEGLGVDLILYTTIGYKEPAEYICSAYTVYIHFDTVYIHFYTMYSLPMQSKCKRLTSLVFWTVHSERSVVVLLHKHFSSWLSTFCNSVGIFTNCTYATISESSITAYSTIHSHLSSQLIVSNFPSVPIVFWQISTQTAPGYVDMHFSLMLVRSQWCGGEN